MDAERVLHLISVSERQSRRKKVTLWIQKRDSSLNRTKAGSASSGRMDDVNSPSPFIDPLVMILDPFPTSFNSSKGSVVHHEEVVFILILVAAVV